MPRTSKPPYGTPLGRGPFAQVVVGCWPINEAAGPPIDIASGVRATSNGATWGRSVYGPALNFSGSGQFVNLGSCPAWSITSLPITILALASPASGTGTTQQIAEFRSPTNAGGYTLNITSAGALNYVTASSGAPTTAASTAGAVDGTLRLLGVTHSATSAGGVQFYNQGIPWGTATNSRVPAAYGSGLLGTNPAQSGNYLNGSIVLLVVLSAALSAAQHAALALNPWRLFAERPLRMPEPAAAAGGTAAPRLYYLNRRRRTG